MRRLAYGSAGACPQVAFAGFGEVEAREPRGLAEGTGSWGFGASAGRERASRAPSEAAPTWPKPQGLSAGHTS